MIKLTRPDGSAIYVRADSIEEIYVDAAYGGRAVIVINGQHQSVLETVQDVDSLLRGSK